MKNTLQQLAIATSSLLLGLTVIHANSAEAVSFDFNGEIESGALVGETFQGSFSYDESLVNGNGMFFSQEYIPVSNLEFNFLGTTFTEADGVPEVAFDGNNLTGLGFNVNNATAGGMQLDFSFVHGFFDISESYFTYAPNNGIGGTGSVTFTEKVDVPVAVPEPTTFLATGLVLGITALSKKKNDKKSNK